MIISMCSALFDYAGDFLLQPDQKDSDFSFVARRVSRSATLDGGCVIVDNGYSPSDATFTVVISQIDNDTRLALLAMARLHSAVTLSVGEHIFSGVIEKIDDTDKMKIKYLVNQQLDEA